jgi:hypothetical protein
LTNIRLEQQGPLSTQMNIYISVKIKRLCVIAYTIIKVLNVVVLFPVVPLALMLSYVSTISSIIG